MDLSVSFDSLIKNILGSGFKENPNGNTVFLFNSLQFERDNEIIEWVKNGAPTFSLVKVPGISCVAYPTTVLETSIIKPTITVIETDTIEVNNKIINVVLNKYGRILSITDIRTEEYSDPFTRKETIARWDPYEGGNVFLLHDDLPIYWDAWDLWIYYQETAKEIKAFEYTIRNLPYQTRIQYKYKISEISSIIQTIIVNAFTSRIDFETQVEWHETHKIIRVYFPLNLRTDFVTCDIQSGNIRRPTTSNTSWETAKYEVCSTNSLI